MPGWPAGAAAAWPTSWAIEAKFRRRRSPERGRSPRQLRPNSSQRPGNELPWKKHGCFNKTIQNKRTWNHQFRKKSGMCFMCSGLFNSFWCQMGVAGTHVKYFDCGNFHQMMLPVFAFQTGDVPSLSFKMRMIK